MSSAGYQNFLGLEIEFAEAHEQKHPILMDATVEQIDSFRFIYTLPFDDKRLLIEDTRYSETNLFSKEEMKKNILKYCEEKNWKIHKILREEIGSLPLPLVPPTVEEQDKIINLAGIFHDTTGYSLPDAIRIIEAFIETDFSYGALKNSLENYREQRLPQRNFFRLLNRLLFKASQPEERYRMLQHFYRLPDPLISDFYAGNFGLYHKLKLFSGKPPVSIKRAILEMMK